MTGVVDTVGKAARHGMALRVECGCGNMRYFMATDVMMLTGAGRELQSVGFRCQICRRRSSRVVPLELDFDRMPNVMVWRPTGGRAGKVTWLPRRLK